MNLKDLEKLHQLADAKYKARQQLFQGLLQRENALRAELHRLDEQARDSQTHNNPEMRSIGADIIWKAWLGKAKSSLNMKLALVLAEKDQHIRQVRKAYGKVLAADELVRTVSSKNKKTKQNEALARAIDITLQTGAINRHQR